MSPAIICTQRFALQYFNYKGTFFAWQIKNYLKRTNKKRKPRSRRSKKQTEEMHASPLTGIFDQIFNSK